MIKDLQSAEIIRFVVSLVLLVGPGYLLSRSLIKDTFFDATHRFIIAIALSMSFWIILLGWCNWLNVQLSSTLALTISCISWLVEFLISVTYYSFFRSIKHKLKLERIILWGVVIFISLINLWSLRWQVVGLGSDSFHHTLIAQLIAENGKIPGDYFPATDKLVSFSYHYGYHAMVAVIKYLCNIPVRLIVVLSGTILIAYSALSTAFLAELLTGRKSAGVIAAAIVGGVSIFPSYMLTWGRYTQLSGLNLLSIFLGVIWFNNQNMPTDRKRWRHILLTGVLAATIALTHYRVAAMALLGAIVHLVFYTLQNRKDLSLLILNIKNLIISALVAVALFLPWAVHLFWRSSTGYPFYLFTNLEENYFSFSRLGETALNYPTNLPILILGGIALLLMVYTKKWDVVWLFLYSLILFIVAFFDITEGFLDPVTILISIYMPIAVMIGWLLSHFFHKVSTRGRWVTGVIFAFIFIRASLLLPTTATLNSSYVRNNDLIAANWIQENIPENAYFMVNLFNFPFSQDFIIGSDAGYWLPVIANRKAVSLPMIYMNEYFKEKDTIKYLRDLYQIQENLTSTDALNLLRREGVTHLFIGEAGGPIDVKKIMVSPNFLLQYHYETDYIFEIKYEN